MWIWINSLCIVLQKYYNLYHCPQLNTMLRWANKLKFCTRDTQTIYALSSGTGTAISVVRVSGSQSYRTLELLSQRQILPQTQNIWSQYQIKPRFAHLKSLYNSQGNVIDHCIFIYFPKHQSYNNQEIVELHLHGSRAVVAAVFKQLKEKGMRMADPGQFTKRALINGKISLVQAESINDLIRSDSQFGRQIAMSNLLGKGTDYLQKLKKQLIRCLANNEAYIDFQEDEGDVKAELFQNNKEKVREVLSSIKSTLINFKNLQIIKEGVNVAIVGRPNVGKSTLINALAKRDVAIVSEEAGTTRDVIQTQIQSGGILLNLFDTAGLRDTTNQIESQGIRRAKQKLQESQIRIFIVDLDQEKVEEGSQGQFEIKLNQLDHQLQYLGEKTILVVNKADKLTQKQRLGKYYIKIENQQGQDKKIYADLVVSANEREGVDKISQVLKALVKRQFNLYENTDQIYFTRERYFDKLTKSAEYLEDYLTEGRPDIACELLRSAISEVNQIFGRTDCEDVLDVLFSEFCIGK